MTDIQVQAQNIINETKQIISNARTNVAKQVNNEILLVYWNIGKIIVENEQQGSSKADYGGQLITSLSKELSKELDSGFSKSNLFNMRALYLNYPIFQMMSGKLTWSHYCELLGVSDKDAKSLVCEDGIIIRSGLSSKHVFLSWNNIKQINYEIGYRERILIDSIENVEETIILEKIKASTDVKKFISVIANVDKNLKIIRTVAPTTNEFEKPDQKLKDFDQQDRRIAKILKGVDADDDFAVMEAWTEHLKKALPFPFKAEIFESEGSGAIKPGSIVDVTRIEDYGDLYGVLASCFCKRKKYSVPLCDLEVVDKDSGNL